MTSSAHAVDALTFRRVASYYPTGVTVVTCVDGGGGVRGMTANSFVTVSVAPPTVLVSINQHGRMHALVSERGVYGVSVLRANDVVLSRHFAGTPDPAVTPEYCYTGGVPLLASAVARFACRVVRAVPVNDHTLFVAEVVACSQASESPLLFFRSRCQSLDTNDSAKERNS
jgi:flavin reductase (DIM6/NTAB) family NADH-FMN oxidoreductase RutF